jgi:hypothetical protein
LIVWIFTQFLLIYFPIQFQRRPLNECQVGIVLAKLARVWGYYFADNQD